MPEERRLINYFPRFIASKEKEGLAVSTIKIKTGHLNCFEDWLKEKKLADLAPKDFSEKIFNAFKKDLQKKKLKDKTVLIYLKTVEDLVNYLQKENVKTSFKENFFNKRERNENDIQQIVNCYFEAKGYSIEEIKADAKKQKIIYSRHTRPAKDLLELAGSVNEAKKAIYKVSLWASSRNLDYAIETVLKKWPEIKKLKPKVKEKKPFFRGDPMVWSKSKRKWFVINPHGDWLEFAGNEDQIDWKYEDDDIEN